MKKLIVHIGYPKTATTTLQHNLLAKLNTDDCRWIHGNPTFNDNSKLPIKCSALISKITSNNINEYNEMDVVEEKTTLKELKDSIYIISDEDLSFRYPGFSWVNCVDAVKNLEKIKKIFSPHFDVIEIVMTIRSQKTILPSFFVQVYNRILEEDSKLNTLEKWFVKRFIKSDQEDLIFDYYKMYRSCIKIFSRKNVHILLYEDLINDPNIYYENISSIFSLEKSEVKEAFSRNRNNTTTRLKKGYVAKRASYFQRNIIGPIKNFFIRKNMDTTYTIMSFISKKLVPSKLKNKKVFVEEIDNSLEQKIVDIFSAKNIALAKDYPLPISKMKSYGYFE